MKPIRVISQSLNLLAEIDDYEYLMFPRSWYGVGMFELRINRYKRNVNLLASGNLIMLGNNSNKAGIILHREIGLDQNGKQSEQWIIRGLALKGILGYRITVPPVNLAYDTKQSNAETVIKHYITNNIVNPLDVNRKIPLIQIATNQNRGGSISWQSRYKNLAEEVEQISLISQLGWNVDLDFNLKKWIFDVKEGRDLSVNQAVNPPVIFSPNFESVESQYFTESKLNYRNVGIVGGQGEGALREIITIGNASGLERLETFIDARDVEDSSQLTTQGQQRMSEFESEMYLESKILTKSPYVYEKNYDLGDIVTIQNRGWGVTRDARITEIKEIYETNGFKLEATFGQSRPTLISKIKQQFSKFENELKR